MDWKPAGWLANRLIVNELTSELVIVHRLPKLLPSKEPRPILPDFDIRIGRLQIDQLRFEEGVTGERRVARVSGEADLRPGRALVALKATVPDGGDEPSFLTDAEPDRDHFDIHAHVATPANTVIRALAGHTRPP